MKENWALVNKKVSEYPVIVSDQEIARRITLIWTKVDDLTSKGGGGKKKKKKPKQKEKEKEELSEDLDKLFDILFCQCEIQTCPEYKCEKMTKCKPKAHVICNCLKQFKIPVIELAFIRDQRLKVGTKGHMQISKVDVKESVKQIESEQGKAKRLSRTTKDTVNPINTPEVQQNENEEDNKNLGH